MRDFFTKSTKAIEGHDSVQTSHQNSLSTAHSLIPESGEALPFDSVPQIQISEMDALKGRSGGSLTNNPLPVNTNSKSHHGGKSGERQLFDRREKGGQGTESPRPEVVHPSMEHAQTENERVFRFAEDSRPMFSPVPKEVPDGEDSPRGFSRPAKDKTSFPSIHVEKCERTPAYAASLSPEPMCLTPDSDMDFEPELAALTQGREGMGSDGRLHVPSPFQPRRTDGRTVLLTRDSNRGMLSSWSRSEGNLPEALRRSNSTPGGRTNLLDIRYRPDWVTRPSLRPASDVALHELRRGTDKDSRSPTPRRLNVRLEPLSPGYRALSASNLHSP